MHSYPVYLVAFIAEFGWSRAETSIAYSVSQMVAGVSSPLVGFLVDRLGPRRLLLLGGGLLVAGLFASAFVTALWQIILLYGIVMTVGANCLGLVVFVPMLSPHFVRRVACAGSAAFLCHCTSWPLPSMSALTSSMPPRCSAWAPFSRSPASL